MKIFKFLGLLYFLGTKIRWIFSSPKKVSVPVICVGNIMVGGTGKTPLVLAIIENLKKEGFNPHVLSRGYGGKLQNQKVNPKKHTAKSVGDEPRMIADYAPVWVGKNRKKTAEMAIKDGATHLIMDDGFQNNTLKKDFSILVFDGAKGVGKNMGLPFGRLRESLLSGLKRTNTVVIVGWDQTNLKGKIKKIKNTPVYFADVKPLKLPNLKKKHIAFAGIGRPEKFFDTLTTLSVRVSETYAFPDHYVYKKSDINRLFARAKKENALLITTEKDSIKLSVADRKKVLTLKIKMVFQKETFFNVLKNKIKG